MSKSYGNIIPLLENEKNLKKSIMKIITNSLEPGTPKDSKNCTVFDLYKNFASENDVINLQKLYDDGISWGDAKDILFNKVNDELEPIRNRYNDLINDKNKINDFLSDGANKARVIAKDKISEIREVIGIKPIT